MNSRLFVTTAAVAIALLTGCGGSQPSISAPGAMPQTSAIATYVDRGKSWMLLEARTAKRLLYVSYSSKIGATYVYNYDTWTLVGRLATPGTPAGQCVDARGDVWITAFNGGAVEYTHGGASPIASLSTNGSAMGCSVSPGGDLAVSVPYNANSYKIGDIEIWKRGRGTPNIYKSKACSTPYSPGYDNEGNLYVESAGSGSDTNVCELPAGGKHLDQIFVTPAFTGAGGAQWDGKHITFSGGNYDGNGLTAIYRAVRGRSGLRIVGKTILSDTCDKDTTVDQPFIVGKENTPINHEEGTVIIGGNVQCPTSTVDFWVYPAGKDPVKVLANVLPPSGQPEGASVSIAP